MKLPPPRDPATESWPRRLRRASASATKTFPGPVPDVWEASPAARGLLAATTNRVNRYPECATPSQGEDHPEPHGDRVSASCRTTLRGLCSLCTHAATCRSPTDPNRPVVQCEKYKTRTLATGGIDGSSSRAASPDVELEAREPSRSGGLCRDCAHGASCVLSRAPGGVWHCEEYE